MEATQGFAGDRYTIPETLGRVRHAPALAQLQAAVQPAPRASGWH